MAAHRSGSSISQRGMNAAVMAPAPPASGPPGLPRDKADPSPGGRRFQARNDRRGSKLARKDLPPGRAARHMAAIHRSGMWARCNGIHQYLRATSSERTSAARSADSSRRSEQTPARRQASLGLTASRCRRLPEAARQTADFTGESQDYASTGGPGDFQGSAGRSDSAWDLSPPTRQSITSSLSHGKSIAGIWAPAPPRSPAGDAPS